MNKNIIVAINVFFIVSPIILNVVSLVCLIYLRSLQSQYIKSGPWCQHYFSFFEVFLTKTLPYFWVYILSLSDNSSTICEYSAFCTFRFPTCASSCRILVFLSSLSIVSLITSLFVFVHRTLLDPTFVLALGSLFRFTFRISWCVV